MKSKSNLVFGVLLIAVAAIFILSAADIIPAKCQNIIISWQMLCLIIGVVSLFTRHYINALLFFVVGAYFLIPHIYSAYELPMPVSKPDFRNIFIASLLIVAAIALIWGNQKVKNRSKGFFDIKTNKDRLPQISCAFGDIDHAVIESPFKGVSANTAFGEMSINMGKTTLPEGDSYLDVHTVFGTTTIFVPESWNVQVSLHTLFGSISNELEGEVPDSHSRLIISGAVILGEIKIRSLLHTRFTENEDHTQETIESISVKQNNRVHIITLNELQYIQADGDYVTLYTSQGKFLKEQTMKYFQNNLPASRFIRIHRSYIVNLSEISSVDCRGKEIYYVILKDGSSLRTSSAGYQILKEKLEI